MFYIFKKKKEKKKEIFEIPREEIVSILEIVDALDGAESKKILRYKLWRKLEGIFPDLNLKDGAWTLNTSHILKASIEKNT